jgi:hypothetical protein
MEADMVMQKEGTMGTSEAYSPSPNNPLCKNPIFFAIGDAHHNSQSVAWCASFMVIW